MHFGFFQYCFIGFDKVIFKGASEEAYPIKNSCELGEQYCNATTQRAAQKAVAKKLLEKKNNTDIE